MLRMYLRRLIVNVDDPVVRVERVKMIANGLQVIALGVLAAAIIAPPFNPVPKQGFLVRLGGGIVAGAIELLALQAIGYISVRAPEEGGKE